MAQICSQCGKENRDGAQFCSGCGAKLTGQPQAGSTQAGPQSQAGAQQQAQGYGPQPQIYTQTVIAGPQQGVRTPGAAASVILAILGEWLAFIPVVGWILGIICEIIALIQGAKSKRYSDVGAVGFFLALMSVIGIIIVAIVMAAAGGSILGMLGAF